jgi:DNA-binding MarR family transcriptional regulator
MPPSKRLTHIDETWNLDQNVHDRMIAATAIVRADRILNKRTTKILTDLGLSTSRYEILITLYFESEPATSLTFLSKGLDIHPATLTYTIDQLVDTGLIIRRDHPTDRRVVMAELTPAGRALVEKANAILSSIGFGLDMVTNREARSITELLGKIKNDI